MSKQNAVVSPVDEFFKKLALPTIINGPAAPQSVIDAEPSPMTPLWQEPERFPALQGITCIQSINKETQSFFATHPHFERLVAILEDLALPIHAPIAMRHPVVNTMFRDFNPLIINSSNDLILFLHRFIFQSVYRILRVLDDSRDWSFTTVNHTSGWNDVCSPERYAVVEPILVHSCGSISESQSVSLVILPLTPWEFTGKDFTNLSLANQVLDYRDSDWITKSDKVWAYLYDICSGLNCYFFVITSYQRWCFGYFMSDWSEIYFTESLNYDNSQGSILGMLIYWVQSSVEVNQIQDNLPGPRPIQTEVKERCGPHVQDFFDFAKAKRQRINKKILRLASADTWKWVQLPIGPRRYRFGRIDNLLRRNHELRRIQDQFYTKQKLTRFREIKKQIRVAKEARRAKKIEEGQAMRVGEDEAAVGVKEQEVKEIGEVQAANGIEEADMIEELSMMEKDEAKQDEVTTEVEDFDMQDHSDSDSEAESDGDLLREKDEEDYNEWRTRVAEEPESPNFTEQFVRGEYTGIYYGNQELEDYLKDLEFQIDVAKYGLVGDLDYGSE